MIHLVLNDLCRPAGEIFRASLQFQGLILHLDGLISLTLTGAAEKRQTAFLGIVGTVLLDESGRAPTYTVMLNPEIIKRDGAYETEEGCLSLLGGPRKCKRYKNIKVQYQTLEMQTRTKNFTGWTAQIIQHEVDHCNGVLI